MEGGAGPGPEAEAAAKQQKKSVWHCSLTLLAYLSLHTKVVADKYCLHQQATSSSQGLVVDTTLLDLNS